jgi:hypothetical protein
MVDEVLNGSLGITLLSKEQRKALSRLELIVLAIVFHQMRYATY